MLPNARAPRPSNLMSAYADLLGEAALRQRARTAEDAARLEAELATRVKAEFVATMSHELRTPLNAVIGFSKLLSEQPRRRLSDAEIAEYADLIRLASVQLLTVINGILDISKLQTGGVTRDDEVVALDDMLRTCVAAFQPVAAERQVMLSVVADLLPPIRGDIAKLRQVIVSLLSNAVRFTPAGGQVRVEASAAADDSVVIAVRDTGIGMTADEIRIALTPFGQVDSGRTRTHEGAGLGLPIARALVELHGGALQVMSEPGRGTDVVVVLPPDPWPQTQPVCNVHDRPLQARVA